MKISKNQSCYYTIGIFLGLLFSFNIFAGALIVDPNEAHLPTPKKRAEAMGTAVGGAGNITPIPKDPNSPQKISCWQNGDLILEQPVIAPAAKSSDMKSLHSKTKDVEIHAIDFRNAFCIIK